MEDNREVQLVFALHAKVRGCWSCTEGPAFLQSAPLSPLLVDAALGEVVQREYIAELSEGGAKPAVS